MRSGDLIRPSPLATAWQAGLTGFTGLLFYGKDLAVRLKA